MIWLLIVPTCVVIYRVARWADRHGVWHPGDGHAEGRFWGTRW